MNNYRTLTLSHGNIGIEREMLRVNDDATLATTAHPQALGKTLTHSYITTDFAETLIELVTAPHNTPAASYQQLLALHRYTAARLGNEKLWAASMPCILPNNEDDITIAHYGNSNNGKIKHLYRKGLAIRYGKMMQMIAGVHFNYSPPDALWKQLAAQDNTHDSQPYRDERYMAMLRNLQRYGWAICALFGASPATHSSFAPARGVLQQINKDTFGWHNATSLRMSELGYQNKVHFIVSFNSIQSYIRDLATAVTTPEPRYQHIGVQNHAGEFVQMTANILQIANEYYNSSRPKQIIRDGELPLLALKKRGIAYVELRLLDINPYDPCGVSLQQLYFLEIFMLWALLNPSRAFRHADLNEINTNRLRVACCGVDHNMTLDHKGKAQTMKSLLDELLQKLAPIAKQLDEEQGSNCYVDSLQEIAYRLNNNALLANEIHKELESKTFIDWAQQLSNRHCQTLQMPIDEKTLQQLNAATALSIEKYREINSQFAIDFNDYLKHYYDPIKELR